MISNFKLERKLPSAQISNSERGVVLVIAFLVMSILLATVLAVSTILVSETKIISNIGNSVSALYGSESGVEKTLYFDRKQIPNGGVRGLCSICSTCDSINCANCAVTALGSSACTAQDCTDCKVSYSSAFDGKTYTLEARVTPNSDGVTHDLNIRAKGDYLNASRSLEVNLRN